ncbi:MAG TPA: alpha/beta hydrolase [Thermoleophilaceae bacterium]|nr:alpha/beta hydrolase [Thermoleophilaceae bacterium]
MSHLTERAAWRAPILGEGKLLDLPSGRRLRYHDVGAGPPIVFVHGLLVNANLWRKLVERLAPDFRCVVLDLPLGSHTLPLAPGTPNAVPDVAASIADAIEALGLEDVTLVGNDSGGALSQVVVTTRPERIGKLVLTSCDYRDNFPPKLFSYFKPAAAVPGLLWALLQPMRLRSQRRSPIAFGWLTKRPIDRAAEDSYVFPSIHNRAIRADARAFIKGADTAQTNAAADRLPQFDKPALIAWAKDDRVFPIADAHKLAADLPNARVELVEDAYTFSMEDNPAQLAELIASFMREPVGAQP